MTPVKLKKGTHIRCTDGSIIVVVKCENGGANSFVYRELRWYERALYWLVPRLVRLLARLRSVLGLR